MSGALKKSLNFWIQTDPLPDNRISSYAVKNRLRYTRYADDITFSGMFDAGDLIKFARHVLGENGLRLNEAKTRLMMPHQRQEVTGIVVNRKLQVDRQARRALRQTIHIIEKFGIDSYLDREKHVRSNNVKHFMGVANFILFVNPEDADALHAIRVLRGLLPSRGSNVG